jgi:hypothetical protein
MSKDKIIKKINSTKSKTNTDIKPNPTQDNLNKNQILYEIF